METQLPELELPITCHDCFERFLLIRALICDALDPDFVSPMLRCEKPESFELSKLFASDKDLRVSTVEVLLAAILWIEANRPAQEILRDCAPEIKDQMVHILNLLDHWLGLKSAIQTDKNIARGSLAAAWIYLLAEFRTDIENFGDHLWWRPKQTPYASD